MATDSGGFALNLAGAWPLGSTVHVSIGPGVQDRAGNIAPAAVSATFPVVADPGLPNNPGFEHGDLSGFTAHVYDDYGAMPVAGQDFGAMHGLTVGQMQAQAQVVDSYAGIQPSEG